MSNFIYILHFDYKFSHAQHYIGSTSNLKARLLAHASGAGSCLTRALFASCRVWRLGALGSCSKISLRRLEKHLKSWKSSSEFCPLCTENPRRIPETTPYPITLLPFPTDSNSILTPLKTPEFSVRFTSPDEPLPTRGWLQRLMKMDKDALGFIPAGGSEGLSYLIPKGQIAIALHSGTPAGYAAFTRNEKERIINIHQTVTEDQYRFFGHGRRMIRTIAEANPSWSLLAKVRDDLAANFFWSSIGFKYIGTTTHKTSGNKLNHYFLLKKDA